MSTSNARNLLYSFFRLREELSRNSYFLFICLSFLFLGSGGCIKHSVEIEERTSAIHYNDRFYDISVVDQSNIWVVGFYGKIIHSKDQGKTWSIQKSGTKNALTGVSFANLSDGWITTLTGKILHTSDGGETWQLQESGTENALMDVEFLDKSHGWVVGANNTVLKTENGGKEWETFNPPAEVIEDATEGIIDTEEAILNAIHFLDLINGWAVGEYGMVYRTNDGGITWVKKNAGITFGDYLFDVHFATPEKGWIVGIGGRIFRTDDGGEHWAPFTSPTENALYTISSTNGQVLAAGTKGTLLMCNSNEWKHCDSHLPSLSWFRSIKFINENSGWIVGGTGTILRTTNGGKEWVAMK